MKEYHQYPMWDASLLLEERLDDLIARLTTEEKIRLIPTREAAVPRLGIPAYNVGGEAAHGVAWKGEATVFPQPLGLSSTWNTRLMREIGSVIGDEARAYHHRDPEVHGLTLWAPTVDLERDPRWGRTEEGYGEDPVLTGEMSAALVKGMQGNDPFYLKMVATLKHFFANNNEKDRLNCSSSIDPRNLREYYLKAFETPFVEGGALSMMTAYNSINGTPAIESPYVNDVVKGEWSMPGFIVCDGGDLSQTVDYHGYHTSHAESAAGALKAGVDCLTDEVDLVVSALEEALGRDLLEVADLDRAIRNIFGVRMRLGQLDQSGRNPYASIPESVLCAPEHAKLSYRAAAESIVLLKNDGLLPLQPEALQKISVIGPLADVVYTDWYSGTLPYHVSVLDGLRNRLPEADVTYVDGNDRIGLKTVDRQVITLGAEGTLVAVPERSALAAEFVHQDWGWGSHTLRSVKNYRYVSLTEHGIYQANAPEIGGWFVKEVVQFDPQTDGSNTLRTWNSIPVGLSEYQGRSTLSPVPPQTEQATGATPDENDDTGRTSQSPSNTPKSVAFEIDIVTRGIEQAVEAARSSQASVVVVGNSPYINGKEEIDRPSLLLPPNQVELVKAVCEANPNTVVVIMGSYPFVLQELKGIARAIVYMTHAGQELGNALADVLLGHYAPAGRLNMTWYEDESQLPDMMDYDIIQNGMTYMYHEGPVQYAFGHGLTYSEFEYEAIRVSRDTTAKSNSTDQLKIEVGVYNKGKRDSDEVVQIYGSAHTSRVKRAQKQLLAFRRVHVKAGSRVTVRFEVPVQKLELWDVTRDRYCLETATWAILAGRSSAGIRQSADIEIEGETIPDRPLDVLTLAENYDACAGVLLDECLEGRSAVRAITREEPLYRDGQSSWISYNHNAVQELHGFEARVAAFGEGGRLEIRSGGPEGELLGVCEVSGPGGSVNGKDMKWTTVQCSLEASHKVNELYIIFKGGAALRHFRLL
ncbi:glycoside hydrolase family 3 C-terminal domain-containing protein [Paenibacillus sp. LS1]|uniref:glycoside hydrolase family 3 C-terminal domain-containing protein n=1 Tax=Paenibacillus sp. LS1 TaxID=2992120 RepID=UPI00222E67BD|nr:glycoside hydrolase family 3 C-terminal domain-containing protein [Paenibacillus sp. LS1]MCW3792291.1 glycoside hydrolase family 3 C-terminal domain-containing protein [Paenibacillus sp. LS1]